jgi:putative ABC transport system permease protein
VEFLNELWHTVNNNKLRTALTGFSVSWGIFMLIILLGVGNGLQNGYQKEFNDDAINSIWLRSGQTSVPYGGMQSGRSIQLDNTDFDQLVSKLDGLEKASARWNQWSGFVFRNGPNAFNYTIKGVHPDHQYVEKTIITEGRYFNAPDINGKRKVCIISEEMELELFPDKTSALGKWVEINGIAFRVVGLFKDEGNENENKVGYIPVTTAQLAFNGQDKIDQIIFTIGDADLEESYQIADAAKSMLAKRHRFSPQDERAVYVRNNVEEFERFAGILRGIKLFVWIIGLMTITAGVIGVSNIMLISIKERTREIGIRKAIGAVPFSIVRMVLGESLVITAFFGYAGMLAGIGLLEFSKQFIPEEGAIFSNPEVDLSIALYATLLLIVAGSLAGLFPALRAARIKPIEAMRAE